MLSGIRQETASGDGSCPVRAHSRLGTANCFGLNVANPSGAIASAVMMLDELGLGDSGRLLSDALEVTLLEGCRTGDLGGSATCSQFGRQVRENLRSGVDRSNAFRELFAMNRGCCG